ncbi:hypothetical protein BDA99DRAFT_539207 [Phascolomyces articulosus]|uniref:Uncharacterized protein n=1 Tax=Phascolomyces articulosus TaxID=60185 RepID=A0AAD5PCL6_9FUNG|nr:hypothetical protein BDA99DRAFT_539207 [Phascolomyces articulosus]
MPNLSKDNTPLASTARVTLDYRNLFFRINSRSTRESTITYEIAQWANDGQGDYVKYHHQLPKSVPGELPKPEFMLTKLIHISDMQVVDGSQVNEGHSEYIFI